VSDRKRPEVPRTPHVAGPDGRIVVELTELLAAIDKLEVAAVAHADAVRRGDAVHVMVTHPSLLRARSEAQDVARRACEGSAELRRMLVGIYEHLITHDGRRVAAKLRPWLR
jgi:hypothetical protein